MFSLHCRDSSIINRLTSSFHTLKHQLNSLSIRLVDKKNLQHEQQQLLKQEVVSTRACLICVRELESELKKKRRIVVTLGWVDFVARRVDS